MLFPRFAFQSVSLRMLAVACLATGQILLGHQSLWGRPQETSASPVIRTPMTIAERSNYLATSRESDILEFLEKLTAEHPMAKLVDVGTTQENRPLWTLVISKEKANPLPLAKDDPRIVIVMIGGIHSGECDGKEALMALARDVLKGRNPDWLERCVLVFLPNFNADGNQRVGPMHRPGQEGPALGMGTRENALGQDLSMLGEPMC